MKIFIDKRIQKHIDNFIIYFEDEQDQTPYINIKNLAEFYKLVDELQFDIQVDVTTYIDSEETPSLFIDAVKHE